MKTLRIGLLSKKRGNYALQERLAQDSSVNDLTSEEVLHHKNALIDAGFDVQLINWGPDFINEIRAASIDLVFNVSSLVEAAILEEYQIPFVGSGTDGIVLARNKALAKDLWLQNDIPTSEFAVFENMKDCESFLEAPSITYPLFIKPVAGRGSAGISPDSKIENGKQLMYQVKLLLTTIGQPVIVERFFGGREVTIGLVGNGETLRTLLPLEIIYKNDQRFLSFDKKEEEEDEFICPADLSQSQKETLQDYAKRAFRCLGLRDYGRIDTKLTPEGFMLLEANSFAGLACTPPEKPQSYIGFMTRAEGKSGSDLLKEIVEVSLERINHQ
jgi:D-alanine-D-alanine ligase